MRDEWIRFADGTVAIVRHGGKRSHRCRCGKLATLQCDYPLGRGRTCDRHLCGLCAVPQGKNRDYCPDHPNQQTALDV